MVWEKTTPLQNLSFQLRPRWKEWGLLETREKCLNLWMNQNEYFFFAKFGLSKLWFNGKNETFLIHILHHRCTAFGWDWYGMNRTFSCGLIWVRMSKYVKINTSICNFRTIRIQMQASKSFSFQVIVLLKMWSGHLRA